MGDIKLYNTRTRRTETFSPLRGNDVRIYVCGLTPSAQAHLGHARSFLFFDLLRRFLTHKGYNVTYVQNVTDIDDRSINAAKATGGFYHDIIDGYYSEFKACMRQFGVAEPDHEPYATHFIEQIQKMIVELIGRGSAYAVQDGIYYRVSSDPNYGALSNRNISELEAGARIEVDEHKEDPLDFALWKFAKPGEPKWPFEPYGEGRPGWHIECSAMSRELLDPEGTGFDIHGGGADLIFPHHENEIAQSEPLMQKPPMSNFWLHGGLLNFEGRKMSKSLGNFEPLVDLLKRHDPQAIRLTFLSTGYSKVMNFTEEAMSASYQALNRLKQCYRSIHTEVEPLPDQGLMDLVTRVESSLENDMNTSVAFAELLNFASNAPGYVKAGRNKANILCEFKTALGLLGIEPDASWLEEPKAELSDDFTAQFLAAVLTQLSINESTVPAAMDRILEVRRQARLAKNWAKSDELRDFLARFSIAVKDSKDGETTWTVNA